MRRTEKNGNPRVPVFHGAKLKSEHRFVQRQRARPALHHFLRQARRLAHGVLGVEMRGGDLGRIEGIGIAWPAVILAWATKAARAIIQPPDTMPIRRRKGTAPTATERTSLP
jgi:hypothetical protein